jgi:arylsulfatase A-like enzyme
LAEYLGSHGYATAGFVANTFYCSYDTGLDRGFTHYADYDLERVGFFRPALLVDLTMKTLAGIVDTLIGSYDSGPLGALKDDLIDWLRVTDKKYAATVNREFLAWLSARPEPGRPFFAFLNYYDAHSRYVLPPGAAYRFGAGPQSEADFQLFDRWHEVPKLRLAERYRTLIRDCYDSCLAYLDERLGELFDELQSRGVLDQTLLIVTADHGEGLGEHDLFDHGESLYATEIRVPLLFVLPASERRPGVVPETVSLRDLPATITELVDLSSGSPFPGQSLTRLWRGPSREATPVSGGEVLSELAAPNPAKPNQGRSPAARGPLVALAGDEFVYIRNERDGSEELFDERDDPRELQNRARTDAMQPVVQRFRARLDQIKADFSKTPR